DKTAGIFEQELAGAFLVFGIYLLGFVAHVVVPVRHALQTFCELADILVEVGNDETSGTAVDRDVEADLLDRAYDQDEVVQVRHRKQRIGARGLYFIDERRGVGEAGRIRLEHHDLDAFGRSQFLEAIRGRGAERGILEDHRDLRRVADEL